MRLSKPLVVFLGGCWVASSAACDRGEDPKSHDAQPAAHAQVELPGGSTVADVAAQVTPSVVNVFSDRESNLRVPGHRHPLARERSLGSGVIVSSDGVILTSNHVVAGGDKIRVALHDDRELEAEVVGTDPESDVAVLRVDAKDLRPIEIADSSTLRIGDLALAIGNPFGIGQAVTMGIISAVGRADMGITAYEDFIQTDAAINPGNSGGALVDMHGRLVGINTAVLTSSGGYLGIGFAIPSNMAIKVKDAILAHGKFTRGWIGVSVENITADLAEALDVKPRRGVVVSDVAEGSPGAKADLAPGDVILAIDGVPMSTSGQLRNVVGMGGVGKRVRLDVERDHKVRRLEVTLGELPAEEANPPIADGMLGGVTVTALDRAKRDQLGIPDLIEGMVVTAVDPSSLAAGIGVREGDIIIEVNGMKTSTSEELGKAAGASDHGVVLLVYRDGDAVLMSFSL